MMLSRKYDCSEIDVLREHQEDGNMRWDGSPRSTEFCFWVLGDAWMVAMSLGPRPEK